MQHGNWNTKTINFWTFFFIDFVSSEEECGVLDRCHLCRWYVLAYSPVCGGGILLSWSPVPTKWKSAAHAASRLPQCYIFCPQNATLKMLKMWQKPKLADNAMLIDLHWRLGQRILLSLGPLKVKVSVSPCKLWRQINGTNRTKESIHQLSVFPLFHWSQWSTRWWLKPTDVSLFPWTAKWASSLDCGGRFQPTSGFLFPSACCWGRGWMGPTHLSLWWMIWSDPGEGSTFGSRFFNSKWGGRTPPFELSHMSRLILSNNRKMLVYWWSKSKI